MLVFRAAILSGLSPGEGVNGADEESNASAFCRTVQEDLLVQTATAAAAAVTVRRENRDADVLTWDWPLSLLLPPSY